MEDYASTYDLLEIPAFLRREHGVTIEKPATDTPVEKPTEFKKLKLPSSMQWREYIVHANEELPLIGSGQRNVYASIGRKWVHIFSSDGYKKCKIPRAMWSQIVRREIGPA